MKTLIVAAALLAALPSTVRAEGPDDVIAAIQRQGGPYTTCLLAITQRETGGTLDPYAINPSSGAYGPFQFLPVGGVWSDSPDAAVPISLTSVDEQTRMAVWALDHGYSSAWGGCP